MRPIRFTLVSLCAIALSLILYAPTFKYFFAFDDVDYINIAGRMNSGELRVERVLLLPHNEHLVAGFRLLFFSYLWFIGLLATPWRIFMAVVHALAAIFLALLARRYAGSTRAALTTALVYVGTCGFSSMWVWFPTAAPVPLLTALLTGAAALVAWRDHLTLRRVLAGIAIVLALLTESAFAPMALIPAAIDEYERRREGRRGIGGFTIFTLAAIIGVVALVSALGTNRFSINVPHAIPRALFLLAVAPFRLFVPRVPLFTMPDTQFAIVNGGIGIVVAVIVGVLLFVLWRRRGVPPLAIIAALTFPAAAGVIGLVGLGRWQSGFVDLYATDRYFFPLLVPIALLAGAVAGSITLARFSRVARTLIIIFIAIVVVGELEVHRRAMLSIIPADNYVRHEARFASLQRLVRMLEAGGVTALPHQDVWMPELHNGRIHTGVFTTLMSRGRIRTMKRVDDAEAARINPIFDRWASESGEAVPFLRVVDGVIVNEHMIWRAAFAPNQNDVSINIGSGDVLLDVDATSPATVSVTLIDAELGMTAPLGNATITRSGRQTLTFSSVPFIGHFGTGRLARMVVEHPPTVRLLYGASKP